MSEAAHIGLTVTSRKIALSAEARISNVNITGDVHPSGPLTESKGISLLTAASPTDKRTTPVEPGETPQGILADKLTLAEITALALRHGVSAGKMTYDDVNDAYTILGSGNDIWSASDQFHYAHTKLNEDGSIAVRIDSIQPISERCK